MLRDSPKDKKPKTWSSEMEEAYWREVAREEGADWARAARAVDPLSWRLARVPSTPWGEGGPWDWSAAPKPRGVSKATFYRALSMVPERDREILTLSLQGRGGRTGDGTACAALLGVPQPLWVQKLDYAEARLAIVAGWATPQGGRWDAERAALASPYPDLVRAYFKSWTSLGAAKLHGLAQSTAYDRLRKCGPVVGAVIDRPVLRGSRRTKNS